MNDVERLESLRGSVQHLGTVSIEDTRWLWEMARRNILAEMMADCEPEWTVPIIPPLAPRRKRCLECDGVGTTGMQPHGKLETVKQCQACGGSGYQQSGNSGEFGGER